MGDSKWTTWRSGKRGKVSSTAETQRLKRPNFLPSESLAHVLGIKLPRPRSQRTRFVTVMSASAVVTYTVLMTFYWTCGLCQVS